MGCTNSRMRNAWRSAIVTSSLAIIEAPHFRAGIVVKRGMVIKTPPILSYMNDWTVTYLRAFVRRQHWNMVIKTE